MMIMRSSRSGTKGPTQNAPSWLPGDDYYVNFHEGDPFIKVDEGYARLPGEGYAALHPELKDVNPEDYPDIHKLALSLIHI